MPTTVSGRSAPNDGRAYLEMAAPHRSASGVKVMVPPSRATEPPLAFPTPLTVRSSPSTSVSSATRSADRARRGDGAGDVAVGGEAGLPSSTRALTLATTYWLKSPKYDRLQVQHRWRGAKDDRARGRRPHRRRRDRRSQVCEHLPQTPGTRPAGRPRAYSPRVGSLTAGAGHSANSSGGCLRVDLRHFLSEHRLS